MTAELNAHSSIDEIFASVQRNASYEEEGDVTKAKRFITAVRMLLMRPEESEQRGNGMDARQRYSHKQLRELLSDAREYVHAYDTATSGTPTIGVDFTEFDRRS